MTFNPLYKTTFTFLTTEASPQKPERTVYASKIPFSDAPSYSKALQSFASYAPNTTFRNVFVLYKIITRVESPKGLDGYYYSERSTAFSHPEVTLDQFKEVLKCCDPDKKYSLQDTEDCWKRVFPGNSSQKTTIT